MNYDNNNNMNYRNTKFKYKEWTTWNGKTASGYHCDDKKLLQHVNVVSFGAQILSEMHSKIDDYLDNVAHHKELQRLHDAGCAEYYASKTRWNNYTGD
jgi:hypothetical protein|tara:strand:+ start:2670 stop:2963 length:294 start_codon:yes stop_codon:yes gene_type:complete